MSVIEIFKTLLQVLYHLGPQFYLIRFYGYNFGFQNLYASLHLHLGLQFDLVKFCGGHFDLQDPLTSLPYHLVDLI